MPELRVLVLAGAVAGLVVMGVLAVAAMAAMIREAARGWPRGRVATDDTADAFAPPPVASGRGVLVVAAGLHLLADVALGAAAQQVGRPDRQGHRLDLKPIA